MTELRVLVLGTGLIGRQRAAALAETPGVSLAATVDPGLADAPTSAPHYASLDDVPLESWDAAIVAVPHDVAVGLAADVLDRRRPALVEKPLGTTAQEARMLVERASGLELPSFVGYNYRFLPAISRLMRLATSGSLGVIRGVELAIGHGGHPGSAEGWKLDPRRAGGGVILDPGVHLLDLLTQILPNAQCTAVDATQGFWKTRIEEDVAAIFHAGDALATIRVSHIRWVNTFRVEVFGEEGYAIAEGRGGNYGEMTLRVGTRWAWSAAPGKSQRDTEALDSFGYVDRSLRDELQSVVRAWRGEQTDETDAHPATFAEAAAVTELVDDLYQRIGG